MKAYEARKRWVEEATCHNLKVSGWYRSHRAVQHRVSPKRDNKHRKCSGKNSLKWWLVWWMALCTQVPSSLWSLPVLNDKRESRWKIEGKSVEHSFFWCSTWQSAGKDGVKQELSQKLNYTSCVMLKSKRFRKEIQRVWKWKPKSLERKSKRFGKEIQRVWKWNPKGLERKSQWFGNEIQRGWKGNPKGLERNSNGFGKEIHRVQKENPKDLERNSRNLGNKPEMFWRRMQRTWTPKSELFESKSTGHWKQTQEVWHESQNVWTASWSAKARKTWFLLKYLWDEVFR